MRYTLGTDQTAALRLERLSSFFNPLSISFIKEYVTVPVQSALDLGCGPGFTTAMLAEATTCPHVCGLDNSARFVKAAQARFKQYTFIKHDVTKFPFPVRGEIIYGRFLLTHLKNIAGLVNRWLEELNGNGMLLMEEVEDIETDVEVFKRYVQITAGLIASQGGFLYAGKLMADALYHAEVVCNEPVSIPVPGSEAGAWFYPNTVSVWKRDRYVIDRLSENQRKAIAEEILDIKEAGQTGKGVAWKLRRLVLKRV